MSDYYALAIAAAGFAYGLWLARKYQKAIDSGVYDHGDC